MAIALLPVSPCVVHTTWSGRRNHTRERLEFVRCMPASDSVEVQDSSQ
jgi:hypothetical protein